MPSCRFVLCAKTVAVESDDATSSVTNRNFCNWGGRAFITDSLIIGRVFGNFRDSLIASLSAIVKDFVIKFSYINHVSVHYAILCAL